MRQGEEVYRYDGTWQGFLCCVFECFERRELPVGICGGEVAQQSLYPPRRIVTNPERGRPVGRLGGETWGGEVRELGRVGVF